MRKTWLYAVSALLFFSCASNNKTTFRTDFFEVKINPEGYLVEFSAGVIEDFGSKSIADKLILAGKVIIFAVSVPIIRSMVTLIGNFLEIL